MESRHGIHTQPETEVTSPVQLVGGERLVDIGRAFTAFMKDPEWIRKVLLGTLISLIPFIGGIVLLGWGLTIVKNTYEGRDDRLPEWDDFGGYLSKGFMAWVGALIWCLPIIVLIVCFSFALAFSANSEAATALVVMLSIGAFMVAIIYASLFLPVPIARYAVRGEFSAMLDFSGILNEIRRGIKPLLIALAVWLIAAGIIAPMGLILCFVGVYVTTTISYVMIGHAMGQAYREIDGKGPMPPSQPDLDNPMSPPYGQSEARF
jgi:hypothetical protein